MDRSRLVTLGSKFFAAVLFVFSLLGLGVSVREGTGVVAPLLAVYLTGLLVVGVFRDATDRQEWQLAFFGGVAVWGGWEYAATGDLLSLGLAVLGVVMVVASLLQIR